MNSFESVIERMREDATGANGEASADEVRAQVEDRANRISALNSHLLRYRHGEEVVDDVVMWLGAVIALTPPEVGLDILESLFLSIAAAREVLETSGFDRLRE